MFSMVLAATPEEPDHIRFLKKSLLSSQYCAAKGCRCFLRRGKTSQNSAWLLLAKIWKNSSKFSSRMAAHLRSSSAFWRGFRSPPTTCAGFSSSMSSTLQPPEVSIRMVSLFFSCRSSSSQSTRGSSQDTL